MDACSLVYLLRLSFQQMIQTFPDCLTADGHLGLRPVHGFARWVLNRGGITSVELAARLEGLEVISQIPKQDQHARQLDEAEEDLEMILPPDLYPAGSSRFAFPST